MFVFLFLQEELMAKDILIKQLRQRFGNKKSISRKELHTFFRQRKPGLKETTFRWHIYKLKEMKIISPVSKEFFVLSNKPVFNPAIDKATKKIFAGVEKQFSTLRFCIWTTSIINEFMLHIPVKHITILQIEKEALEPVYDYLKKQKLGDIFIKPVEKEIERYIFESEKSIVLLPLVSKSPIQKINGTKTTTLEKLIVDLFSDKKIFAAFQGSELTHIINNAYNRYAIDFTKLFHYAKRRRKDKAIRDFFAGKTGIPKYLLND